MTDERYMTLARLLNKRSVEGKVGWAEGEREGEYRVGFGDLSIDVREEPDDDYPESPDYFVRILNTRGRLVEEFSNRDFRDMDGAADTYAVLRELYHSARRSAMGVEQALHDLMRELRDTDDLPF